MSTFGNAKMLKSIYINTFGFYTFLNTPESLAVYSFQGFPQRCLPAHCFLPCKKALFPKVLIFSPLGTFSGYGHVKAMKRNVGLLGGNAYETEPNHLVFIVKAHIHRFYRILILNPSV
jgi:hypothetical protein